MPGRPHGALHAELRRALWLTLPARARAVVGAREAAQTRASLKAVAQAFASALDLDDAARARIARRLAPTAAEAPTDGRFAVLSDGMATRAQAMELRAHDHMLIYAGRRSDGASQYRCPDGLAATDRFELLVRAIESVAVFDKVLRAGRRTYGDAVDLQPTPLEIGDCPANSDGVAAYGRPVGSDGVVLIPDIYYVLSGGYRHRKRAKYPAWPDRVSSALWRGGTTGFAGLTVGNLAALPRYRLCQAAAERGDGKLDCRFAAVSQAVSDQDRAGIETALRGLGYWSEHVAQQEMASYRFLIDIDGNANSWSLLEKMHYGSCILKVESPHEQWFYPDLAPWEHFVPVKADLSDLHEVFEWCLGHDHHCRTIAENAARFARTMDFSNTMTGAYDRLGEGFGS